MADQRKHGITWTEQTWNPIRGCQRITDECRNCYAERVAARFSGPGQPYHGLARQNAAGGQWTGVIQVIEDHLLDPLRWKRPRLAFTNSMSDLFYPDLPIKEIDRIVLVMALARRHTFQVLTKRWARMADYLTDPDLPWRLGQLFMSWPDANAFRSYDDTVIEQLRPGGPARVHWPLPNVWWGFSAGRQRTFDDAMPHLVRMERHAKVRWWSAEPLLEPIDCDPAYDPTGPSGRGTNVNREWWLQNLDWVVVGGESQDGARTMLPDWARAIKARCDNRTDMGRPWPLPFHMKQLGGHPNPRKKLAELPEDLRVRDYPVGYQRPA